MHSYWEQLKLTVKNISKSKNAFIGCNLISNFRDPTWLPWRSRTSNFVRLSRPSIFFILKFNRRWQRHHVKNDIGTQILTAWIHSIFFIVYPSLIYVQINTKLQSNSLDVLNRIWIQTMLRSCTLMFHFNITSSWQIEACTCSFQAWEHEAISASRVPRCSRSGCRRSREI